MTQIYELELVFQIKGATVASAVNIPLYQCMYERMLGHVQQGDMDKALKSVALHQLIFDPSHAPAGLQSVLDVDGEVIINLTAENSNNSLELCNGRAMFCLMAHVVVKLRSTLTTAAFISWYAKHQRELLKCLAMSAGNVQGGQFELVSPVSRTHSSEKRARCVKKLEDIGAAQRWGRAQNDRDTCHRATAKPKHSSRRTTAGRLG